MKEVSTECLRLPSVRVRLAVTLSNGRACIMSGILGCFRHRKVNALWCLRHYSESTSAIIVSSPFSAQGVAP